MTPENVADAVIKHDATDWSKVRPLAKGKKGYNIRLDVNTEEEKAVARKYVQWIYRLETGDIPATLLDDLKNDMKVVKEFEKWRDGEPRDYEYKNTYKELISRLRTAPVVTKSDSDSETPKDEPIAQQQVSPTREQASHADEGPGEEPEPFTPEEVDNMHDALYKDNHTKLMTFLNDKAKTVIYLSYNLTEEKNIGYIQQFARRNDFERIYRTLTDNANRPGVSATSIMQFIRNVVLHNILEWGAPAPR